MNPGESLTRPLAALDENYAEAVDTFHPAGVVRPYEPLHSRAMVCT